MRAVPIASIAMAAVAGALALAVASCGPSPVPRVSPELVAVAQQGDATASAADLERGRAIYTARCSTCHALPRPIDYDAPTWRSWMRSMAPKAKLDDEQ